MTKRTYIFVCRVQLGLVNGSGDVMYVKVGMYVKRFVRELILNE